MAKTQKGTVLKTIWLCVFIVGAIFYFLGAGLLEKAFESTKRKKKSDLTTKST